MAQWRTSTLPTAAATLLTTHATTPTQQKGTISKFVTYLVFIPQPVLAANTGVWG